MNELHLCRSGSGCIISFIDRLGQDISKQNISTRVGVGAPVPAELSSDATHNHHSAFLLSVDINLDAALATLKTGKQNGVRYLDAVRGDLFQCFRQFKKGTAPFDFIVFNPPYVPTPIEETRTVGIEASWAGGKHGRKIIDRFLSSIPDYLGYNGFLYLLLEKRNKPEEVIMTMSNRGFNSKEILTRKARNEHLCIIRFSRKTQHNLLNI